MHDAFIRHPCWWYDHEGNRVAPPETAGEYLANGMSSYYISKSPSGETMPNGCCQPVSGWIEGDGNDTLMTNDPAVLCESDYRTDPNGGFGIDLEDYYIWGLLFVGVLGLVVLT